MPRKIMKYVHKKVTRHGETVYYYKRGDSGKVRLPDEYGTPEFLAAYWTAAQGGRPVVPRIGVYARRAVRSAATLSRIMVGCRSRAKRLGRPFDLSTDWLEDLVKRQNYRCAVTGLALDLKMRSCRGERNPYAPSIDRIDCKGGYTKENVRIVAFAVNIMLSDWGTDVLGAVARSYITKLNRSICPPKLQRVPTVVILQ